MDLNDMKLPELWALFAEVTGEATKAPNRGFLIRRITEARAAAAEQVAEAERVAAAATAAGADGRVGEGQTPAPERLTQMSVHALRALYLEVLGRDTGSIDRAYLVWKIREARKGKVKVGPIERAPKVQAGAAGDVVTLPLRLPRHEVEELDKVWKAAGFPSRTAFLRRAITEYTGLRAVDG